VTTQSVPKASLFSASDASTYLKRLVKDVGTITKDKRRPAQMPVPWSRSCGHYLVRLLVSLDALSLAAEIEACHNSLQTEGGKAVQAFLVKDSSVGETERTCKRFKGELPMELQIASTEQKSAYFDWWLQEKQQQLEERRMSVQKQLEQQEDERRQQQPLYRADTVC
jgi:hypothetical protein